MSCADKVFGKGSLNSDIEITSQQFEVTCTGDVLGLAGGCDVLLLAADQPPVPQPSSVPGVTSRTVLEPFNPEIVPATPLTPQQNPSSRHETEFPGGTGCSGAGVKPLQADELHRPAAVCGLRG
jgi:hypothetical protein